jgi:hypothetical protein
VIEGGKTGKAAKSPHVLPPCGLCGRSGEGLGMEATEDEDRGIGGVEFGLKLFLCVWLTTKFWW